MSVLNTVGDAMTRAVAKALDAKALSTDAATATAPAGIRSLTLPGVSGAVDTTSLLTAVGALEAAGGKANAIYLNPTDVTAIRIAIVAGGYNISDPTAPGAEQIGGARLYPTAAIPAGSALVAEARQILIGLRQDATVQFSEHAKFTADSVVARVICRADFDVNDSNGLYAIAEWLTSATRHSCRSSSPGRRSRPAARLRPARRPWRSRSRTAWSSPPARTVRPLAAREIATMPVRQVMPTAAVVPAAKFKVKKAFVFDGLPLEPGAFCSSSPSGR